MRLAQSDFNAIWNYYAEHFGVTSADRLVKRLDAKLRSLLGAFPTGGRERLDLGLDIRSLTVESYVAIYRIAENSIHILRLPHGSQDLTQIHVSYMPLVFVNEGTIAA